MSLGSEITRFVRGPVPGLVISAVSQVGYVYFAKFSSGNFSFLFQNIFSGIHFTSIYEFVLPLVKIVYDPPNMPLNNEIKRNIASTIVHEVHAGYDYISNNMVEGKEFNPTPFIKPLVKNSLIIICKIGVRVTSKLGISSCNIFGEVATKYTEGLMSYSANMGVNWGYSIFMGTYRVYHPDLDMFFGKYMDKPLNFYFNGVIRSIVQDSSKYVFQFLDELVSPEQIEIEHANNITNAVCLIEIQNHKDATIKENSGFCETNYHLV